MKELAHLPSMYPSYTHLPPSDKVLQARSTLNRKLAKTKKLDHPVLVGFTVLLLLMGLVVLGLGVTSQIKLEEKEDAGLTGQIVTDLRTVTISLTVLGSVQTAQSIFAIIAVTINRFPFLVAYLVTGILVMVGNVSVAGYAFYCREETHDYVQENLACSICEVSHDVVFKYALPAMAIAMATFVFHGIAFIALYRVMKYAHRKAHLKAAEKKLKVGPPRKYVRPQSNQWNEFGHIPPHLSMPPYYPPPFQYPSPPSPHLSYLDTYPQVPTSGYSPYGYAGPYGPGYPYEDVHRGMTLPGYTLGGLNNFMLPDGTTVQENYYQPKPKPKNEYSWRSHKAPLLPAHEAGEDKNCMFQRNGDGHYK